MKTILITGKNGMLATDCVKIFAEKYKIFAYGREEMDICDYDQCEKIISQIRPNVVLNCAGYTDVENAEGSGREQNYAVNAYGVQNLAKITKKCGIDFLTISTDYVFDGENPFGYTENDEPNPINHYGKAKLLGEQLSKAENQNTIIVRTSWLFGGENHKNFVNTMLSLAEQKSEISVVNDQYGLPTFTEDLAFALEKVIDSIQKYRGNIFHFSNTSENMISWCDFAREIFSQMNKNILVLPCSSQDFPTNVNRPKNSVLRNNSEIILPDCHEALNKYIKKHRL